MLASRTFRNLQVETDPLAIDENRPSINQLLSGAVVGFVAAQRAEGEEKLHSLCA